ncbi:hypothetical protein DSM14862_01534 [Sulfitobacter indolifex]|uniref:Uncharacterized protein n=1 Tax=Sulfitobacter indolifex HEL-45 TaxID=391624 RepID=A0ABP2D8T5_9RHOB|nr:hypothetical protein [Sulfitobacter indolifex]EDQ04665.1 hypothetical protein OIHEL45_13230 [Sulfitobacter indolifex HEL-45]UOA18759.1 hypothetical protein DSM14862_01534 [Sulfitobacter indolifex]
MNNHVMAAEAMAFCVGGAKAEIRVQTAVKNAARARFYSHLTETVTFQNRISL